MSPQFKIIISFLYQLKKKYIIIHSLANILFSWPRYQTAIVSLSTGVTPLKSSARKLGKKEITCRRQLGSSFMGFPCNVSFYSDVIPDNFQTSDNLVIWLP
eukprot:TRINITY_DN33209_c0_g1_i5.p4 TRINITY_DN33209_c0_g1~~TRINITY_DN33209_c0_g1_i5.p4  ORF type:complete len:101 (-),score=1.38 TRINITY_DN33209_c0_g1_i5:355-657(-)